MAYSEARKRATMKYQKEACKRVQVVYKNEDYAEVAQAAADVGEPVATYIKNAVRERMERGY